MTIRTTATLLTLLTFTLAGCPPGLDAGPGITDMVEGDLRRMPAEWEPQAAVWMQWPHPWEGPQVQAAFVHIIEVITEYEDVRLVVNDEGDGGRALAALAGADAARLQIHVIPTDSSWMRDNGPRYVEVDGALVLQNWEFDAWGSGTEEGWPFANDNAVPDAVAGLLDLPVEGVSMIHERGDLEVNGADTAMVNWSVVSHRNPGQSREELTAVFQQALGVDSVIWVEGFDPIDVTRGHVDGMARFVAEDTVLVGKDGTQLMERIAEQIAEQRPDLTLERLEAYDAALFLNFLVGNGFVLVGTSGEDAQDAEARRVLEGIFPDRDIRFVDVDALWANGGGIHCVTNDQPVIR
jgi:agmatine deiminase